MVGKMGPIGETIELIEEEAEKGSKTAVQQVTGKGQGQQQDAPVVKQQTQTGQKQTQPPQKPPSDQGKPADDVPADLKQATKAVDKAQDETKTFLKYLYGTTPEITKAEIEKKELEDKQKQEALRQRLHNQYFQPLITPHKPKEERTREKLEKEEEEKKQALALEEKKKQDEELPIIITKERGTKERLRGVSG